VPDYCILISSNFRQVLAQLQANPTVGGRAQLLGISIDPEHDTPQVLRDRRHYTGTVDPDFRHWQFASGSTDETRKAADFFGLFYDDKQWQIVHTLRTLLVSGDGRIVKLSGNQSKPTDVARDYTAAVVGFSALIGIAKQ
jgi:cytochrome oxidase Cu insertion factor (SCO1/SenC/PrrC family)